MRISYVGLRNGGRITSHESRTTKNLSGRTNPFRRKTKAAKMKSPKSKGEGVQESRMREVEEEETAKSVVAKRTHRAVSPRPRSRQAALCPMRLMGRRACAGECCCRARNGRTGHGVPCSGDHSAKRALANSRGSKGSMSSGVSPRPTNLTGTPSWSRMPMTTPPLAEPSSLARKMPLMETCSQ